MQNLPELRARALAALQAAAPDAKVAAAVALCNDTLALDCAATLNEPTGLPGRPERPRLVPPAALPRRSIGTTAGRAALLHAIAHIEFNAIDLALDAVWRFAELPGDFYRDWAQVAAEEARHFQLLRDRLRDLGCDYGDFDAHTGLWDMARKTASDVLARMALVPRTLEARGLDASPGIRARLAAAGDARSAEIIDLILRDEIGHVAIGNRWFRFLCEARGLDSHSAYPALAQRFGAPRLRGPFNLVARRAAGFDESELRSLELDPATASPTLPGLAEPRDRSHVGSNPT